MGEKGNAAGAVGAAAGVVLGTSESLIERVTDTATSTVTGVGQDFLETVKDKSIGAVADNTVAAARQRMQRKPGEPGEPSGAAAAPEEDEASPGDATPPQA